MTCPHLLPLIMVEFIIFHITNLLKTPSYSLSIISTWHKHISLTLQDMFSSKWLTLLSDGVYWCHHKHIVYNQQLRNCLKIIHLFYTYLLSTYRILSTILARGIHKWTKQASITGPWSLYHLFLWSLLASYLKVFKIFFTFHRCCPPPPLLLHRNLNTSFTQELEWIHYLF